VDDVQFISFHSDLLDRVKAQCDERGLHPDLDCVTTNYRLFR